MASISFPQPHQKQSPGSNRSRTSVLSIVSNPLQLLDKPVPKEAFKARVKLKVTEYWQALLRMEAAPLRSLQYFKLELYSLNKPHYMWMSAASNP